MTDRCTDPARGALLSSYELGLLDAGERRSVEAHLASCASCREDAYGSAPLAAALTGDAAAIDAALAGGRAAAGADRKGAGVVPSVRQRLRELVPFPRILVPAGAIAAVALVLLLRPATPDPRDLAHVKPLPYVPMEVRDAGSDEASAAFARGMERYGEGDWPAAVSALRQALDAERAPLEGVKRAQADLFLGVSLLLADDADAALAPLQRATASPVPVLADRARWFLAQAHLLRGDADAASRQLEALAGSIAYGEDATVLLRQLGRRPR